MRRNGRVGGKARVGLLFEREGSGPSIGVLRALDRAGYEVHAFTEPGRFDVRYSRRWSGYRTRPDRLFGSGWQAWLSRQIARSGVEALVPVGVPATEALLESGCDLGCRLFPMPTLEALNRLGNKWSFHQLMGSLGLPSPRTLILEGAELTALNEDLFPALLKPLSGQGGEGIFRVKAKADFLKFHSGVGKSGSPPQILQKFEPGLHVGLNLLTHQGKVLAWTQHYEPTIRGGLEFFEDPEILKAGAQITRALNLSGVFNFDLLQSERDGRFVFLECNPRFWRRAWLSAEAGVDFASLGVELALSGRISATSPAALGGLLYPFERRRGAGWGAPRLRSLGLRDLRAAGAILGDPAPALFGLWRASRSRLSSPSLKRGGAG